MSTSRKKIKAGHVCPESHAMHPRDRWETLFVYSFIRKFTNIKVDGFDEPPDLENALMIPEPNPIMITILTRFVLNLRPQTRNLSGDQISATVASVIADYCKNTGKTVFWNEELNRNVDPFQGLDVGFFTATWDFKLKILRQLVELQLSFSIEIRNIIDRAWGISTSRSKRKDTATVADTPSQADLQMVPLGQDFSRKRYWVADDSPRIYISNNPWKMTSSFQTISSNRDEYMGVIRKLQQDTPDADAKPMKLAAGHKQLIRKLEERVGVIDAEIARVQRVKRKTEQLATLLAQAEFRVTRTRQQTHRPDYGLADGGESDEGDEFTYQEDEGYDDDFDEASEGNNGHERSRRNGRLSAQSGTRRSSRSTVVNANRNKRKSEDDPWQNWRGERRSRRLGAPEDVQIDNPANKRARTEDSVMSNSSADAASDASRRNVRVKATGAAALKPSEVAMEQVAGKKKSRYWVYAVEPDQEDSFLDAPTSTSQDVNDQDGQSEQQMDVDDDHQQNPHTNGHSPNYWVEEENTGVRNAE